MDPNTESLSSAMRRLSQAGYPSVDATEDGELLLGGQPAPPEDVIIDEVVRFEGETDPADEQILFALQHKKTGARGTWLSTFGAHMTEAQTRIAQRLQWGPDA